MVNKEPHPAEGDVHFMLVGVALPNDNDKLCTPTFICMKYKEKLTETLASDNWIVKEAYDQANFKEELLLVLQIKKKINDIHKNNIKCNVKLPAVVHSQATNIFSEHEGYATV